MIKSCNIPTFGWFLCYLSPPERSEDTADTMNALCTVFKASNMSQMHLKLKTILFYVNQTKNKAKILEKYPFAADFHVFIWCLEGHEGIVDTLRPLHIILKAWKYAIDTFRTKYLVILCDSSTKLVQNLVKIPI